MCVHNYLIISLFYFFSVHFQLNPFQHIKKHSFDDKQLLITLSLLNIVVGNRSTINEINLLPFIFLSLLIENHLSDDLCFK